MWHREPVPGWSSGRRRAAVLAAACSLVLACASPTRAADGLWDSLLETMNVKPAPAAPGPDFVERSRPDPSGLGYLPTAQPHKVSPVAVKTPDQIQAEKDALDLAEKRQLDPRAAGPAPIAKAAPATPAPAAKKHRGTKSARLSD